MMSLFVGFLTFLLVMNCLFLILLVLIQLPKKEAGAGVAFGGGATDALFGAGSGNALTNVTKYSASVFVGLAVLLSMMNSTRAKEGNRRLEEELLKKANAAAAVQPQTPAANPVQQTTAVVTTTNPTPVVVTAQPAAKLAEAPLAPTQVATNPAPAPVVIKQAATNPAPVSIAPAVTRPATNPAPAPAPKK